MPPWKFFIQIVLIITTTVNIYEISNTLTPYSRAQAINWQSMSIPESISHTVTGTETTYYIYTVDELMTCISYFVSRYYSLNTTVVGSYRYIHVDDDPSNSIQPVTLSITSFKYPTQIFDPNNDDFDDTTISESYELTTNTDLGPFNNESNRLHLVQSLQSMAMTFEVNNLGYNHGFRTCYVDTVTQKYNFKYRGRIDLIMEPSVVICDEQYDNSLLQREYAILVIFLVSTVALSALLQFLHIKAVFKHISIFQLAKSKKKEQFRGLSFADKLEFFNFWFITTTIANAGNIIGSLWLLNMLLNIKSGNEWQVPLFFTGLGCMFTWISGIQYFEMFPEYYALILTLRKSAPRVLAFLVGVMPVFLGFAYFGVAFFSTGSELFSDVDHASVALFALLNGDVIHDVFDDIYPISPTLSRIYLYTFISLFIYAVLNIFIAIVEDAFFAAKQETELEIEEDVAQKDMNVYNLDVVGLVAGPPVPVTNSMMHFNDEDSHRRMDSLIGIHPVGMLSDSDLMSNMNVNTRGTSKTVPLIQQSPQFFGHSYGNSMASVLSSDHEDHDHSTDNLSAATSPRKSKHRKGKSELAVPLISPARLERATKSERILLQTFGDSNVETRQVRHQEFVKVLGQMVASYNKQFLNEIKGILSSVPVELRPPHSFDHYPCGFNDCVYCQVKTLLQSNLQTLRNNVVHSIENGINGQRMRAAITPVSTLNAATSGGNRHSDVRGTIDEDEEVNIHKGSM